MLNNENEKTIATGDNTDEKHTGRRNWIQKNTIRKHGDRRRNDGHL